MLVFRFKLDEFPEVACDPVLLYHEIKNDPQNGGERVLKVSVGFGERVRIVFTGTPPLRRDVAKYVNAHRPRKYHTEEFERQYPRQAWALDHMPQLNQVIEIKEAIQQGTGFKYAQDLWELADWIEGQARISSKGVWDMAADGDLVREVLAELGGIPGKRV